MKIGGALKMVDNSLKMYEKVAFISAAMLGYYFYVLFKNGISLNEITIKFSLLYLCSCLLIHLFVWMLHKGIAKTQVYIAIPLVIISVGIYSYYALTEIPDRKTATQIEMATILGNSEEYKALGIEHIHDIEKVIFHGETRFGGFDQIYGYVVEVMVPNDKQRYFFECEGTGPYCTNYIRIDESKALQMIEGFQ